MFRELTRRDLPDVGDSLDDVSESVRARVGAIWLQRASSEAGAGAAFAYVRDSVDRGVADGVVKDLAHRAVEDEARHAEICRRLACVYLGEDVRVDAAPVETFPTHQGASQELDLALQLVGMSCINESLACAFVEACMRDATPPFLHALHREHLHDEVNHARVGFAHLASQAVSPKLKAEITEWLPRIVVSNARNWLARLDTLPDAGAPGHAYPSKVRLREVALDTIDTLVIPGLVHVNVDTRSLQGWRALLRA